MQALILKSRVGSSETCVTLVTLESSSADGSFPAGLGTFLCKSFSFLNIDGVIIFTAYSGSTSEAQTCLQFRCVLGSETALKYCSHPLLMDGYSRISFGILAVPCSLVELLF